MWRLVDRVSTRKDESESEWRDGDADGGDRRCIRVGAIKVSKSDADLKPGAASNLLDLRKTQAEFESTRLIYDSTSPGVDFRQLQFSVESTSSTRSRLSKYFLKTLLNPFAHAWRMKRWLRLHSFCLLSESCLLCSCRRRYSWFTFLPSFTVWALTVRPARTRSPDEIIDVRMGTCEISPVEAQFIILYQSPRHLFLMFGFTLRKLLKTVKPHGFANTANRKKRYR